MATTMRRDTMRVQRGTGQSGNSTWTPERVAVAPDPALAWCEYVRQVLGVPFPTGVDLGETRQAIGDLFVQYPTANYYTLCRLVMWCRGRKLRFSRMKSVVGMFREAWAKGALPELDPKNADESVEQRIIRVLEVEHEPAWRYRLLTTMGNDHRRATLLEWEAVHSWSS